MIVKASDSSETRYFSLSGSANTISVRSNGEINDYTAGGSGGAVDPIINNIADFETMTFPYPMGARLMVGATPIPFTYYRSPTGDAMRITRDPAVTTRIGRVVGSNQVIWNTNLVIDLNNSPPPDLRNVGNTAETLSTSDFVWIENATGTPTGGFDVNSTGPGAITAPTDFRIAGAGLILPANTDIELDGTLSGAATSVYGVVENAVVFYADPTDTANQLAANTSYEWNGTSWEVSAAASSAEANDPSTFTATEFSGFLNSVNSDPDPGQFAISRNTWDNRVDPRTYTDRAGNGDAWPSTAILIIDNGGAAINIAQTASGDYITLWRNSTEWAVYTSDGGGIVPGGSTLGDNAAVPMTLVNSEGSLSLNQYIISSANGSTASNDDIVNTSGTVNYKLDPYSTLRVGSLTKSQTFYSYLFG